MPKRGRPRSTWQHLKNRGAKPSVWQRRRKEGEPQPPPAPEKIKPLVEVDPDALPVFMAALRREENTFQKRCAPGEILTREYGAPYNWPEAGPGYFEHGATFDWRRDSLLWKIRNFAQTVVSREFPLGPIHTADAGTFLNDLEHQTIYRLDCVAVANIPLWFAAFAPDATLQWSQWLQFAMYLGWKSLKGEYRYAESDWELTNPVHDKVLRQGFDALEAERKKEN